MMDNLKEIQRFESEFWKNKPIYAIWGYIDAEVEKLFVTESADEAKKKMIDLIQNSDMYEYDRYGMSLGAQSDIDSTFDFYTYLPEKSAEFDIETELLDMENSLRIDTYKIYAYKGTDIKLLFTTDSFSNIKKEMRKIIEETVNSDTPPEWGCYTVAANDEDCYDFDAKSAYMKVRQGR